MTAGILLITALTIYLGKEREFPHAAGRLSFIAPIALSVGMGALFLDIEYKLHVFRFYTAFKITSPMSWGSWILLLVYPLSLILILGRIKISCPKLYEKLNGRGDRLIAFSEKHLHLASAITIFVATTLGIYTGILLSSLGARPFWNASILGPIFLISGLSTALALNVILAQEKHEIHFFSKYDLFMILAEIVTVLLFVISLSSGPQISQESVKLILWGDMTAIFWVFFMGFGLVAPLILEILELKGMKISKYIAPALVLFGGLLFRFIMVEAGQLTGYIGY